MTQPPPPPPPPPPVEQSGVCYRHPDRETGVRCVRCDRPICPACMTAASVGFQCPECVAEGRKSVRAPRTVYGGAMPRGGYDVTTLLVAINVVVFGITVASGASLWDGTGGSDIYAKYAMNAPQVAGGEWWRLFTSMFLHFGLPHIFFNMWALLFVGRPLEQILGRLRFVVLYVLSGLGGSLLSFALGPLAAHAAGASGAIFGLFGAFYVITRRRGLETGPIVGLIAINLFISFTVPNIDWRGHIGGLITGAVVAMALVVPRPSPNRSTLQAAGCVAVAVVLAASGLVAAHHVQSECDDVAASFQTGAFTAADLPALGSCGAAGLIEGVPNRIAG